MRTAIGSGRGKLSVAECRGHKSLRVSFSAQQADERVAGVELTKDILSVDLMDGRLSACRSSGIHVC